MTEKPETRTGIPQQASPQAGSTSTGAAAGAAARPETPPYAAPSHAERPMTPRSGWVGWIIFGAMMMVLAGTFHVISGLTALYNSSYYLVGSDNLLVSVNFTTWGWTHLILGIVAVAAGIGLFSGRMWARVAGIAVAMVSALVNLAFLSAYPVWSLTVIALDILVVYAIAVHGEELQE